MSMDSLPPFELDPKAWKLDRLGWTEETTAGDLPRVRAPDPPVYRRPPVPGAQRITLAVFSEHIQSVVVPLVDELVFGRSVECDFTWTWDRAISRQHCRIYREGSEVFLEDLGSHHGTFVNGALIDRVPLHGGETITLGHTTFEAFVLRVDQPE